MKEETIKKYEIGKQMYSNGMSTRQISKELHIGRKPFSEWLKSVGVEVNPLPHKKNINENIFNEINTEEKAYWLGFLYADGCVASGNRNDVELSLQLSDIEHIQKFKQFIGFEGKLMTDDFRCRVSFKNKQIHTDLINLGCTPRKSLTLKFPNREQVSENLIRHFIRGYFDGDGCLTFTEKTIGVNILGTYDFLNAICDICNISKDRIYISKSKSNQVYRIVLSGKNDLLNFTSFIYDDCNVYLERKYLKYKQLIKYYSAV